MNIIKKCKYCSEPFEKKFNNQVYCSKFCAKRMTDIKKRLRQKQLLGTLEPRTCKLCSKSFRFHGMKFNCPDCIELLKQYPHYYRKGKTNDNSSNNRTDDTK